MNRIKAKYKFKKNQLMFKCPWYHQWTNWCWRGFKTMTAIYRPSKKRNLYAGSAQQAQENSQLGTYVRPLSPSNYNSSDTVQNVWEKTITTAPTSVLSFHKTGAGV